MDRDVIIEDVKKHIQKLRKDCLVLSDKEFKIALGKVIIELKDAKKHDKDILKNIFSL